jgi:hypothetical protein
MISRFLEQQTATPEGFMQLRAHSLSIVLNRPPIYRLDSLKAIET